MRPTHRVRRFLIPLCLICFLNFFPYKSETNSRLGFFSRWKIRSFNNRESAFAVDQEIGDEVSAWQASLCALAGLNIRDARSLQVLCSQLLNGKFATDEVSCVEHLLLYSGLHVRCVSADHTDVLADIPTLMKLRERRRNSTAPQVLIRNRVLATVCAKNETRLLLISLTWHLLLGFDHFYICNNSPRSHRLSFTLRPFERSGLVTIVNYSGVGVQHTCFDDGLTFARENGFTWQGGLDVDEFLVLGKNYSTVQQVLELFHSVKAGNFEAGAVSFNWIMQPGFDRLTVDYPKDSFITPAEKLGYFIGSPHQFVKSFAKVSLTRSWQHVHMPTKFWRENVSAVNTAGIPIPGVQLMADFKPVIHLGAVFHFRHRTAQELVAKRERGRATIDCESKGSSTDSRCGKVFKARNSTKKVSDILTDYFSHTHCVSLNCTGVHEIRRAKWQSEKISESVIDSASHAELIDQYKELGFETKQVLKNANLKSMSGALTGLLS